MLIYRDYYVDKL